LIDKKADCLVCQILTKNGPVESRQDPASDPFLQSYFFVRTSSSTTALLSHLVFLSLHQTVSSSLVLGAGGRDMPFLSAGVAGFAATASTATVRRCLAGALTREVTFLATLEAGAATSTTSAASAAA